MSSIFMGLALFINILFIVVAVIECLYALSLCEMYVMVRPKTNFQHWLTNKSIECDTILYNTTFGEKKSSSAPLLEMEKIYGI